MIELGIYHETLSIDKSDITIMGMEKNGRLPILDGKNVLPDAAVGSGSNIEIRGIIARDFTSNGLMLNQSTNVTFRDVACHNTGLYGIYPVECVGVLIENCTVTGVRDAALYVGQSKDCLLYTSPSPRDKRHSRMPSSA